MNEGHRVHRGATQRIAQHIGLDRAAERDVEPDALLAAGADQFRETFAE